MKGFLDESLVVSSTSLELSEIETEQQQELQPGDYIQKLLEDLKSNIHNRVRLGYIDPLLKPLLLQQLQESNIDWISFEYFESDFISILDKVTFFDLDRIDIHVANRLASRITNSKKKGIKVTVNSEFGYDLCILKSLKTMRDLMYVEIDGILDERYFNYLADAIETCPIVYLKIDNEKCIDLQSIAEAMQFNKTIRHVELHGRYLNHEAFFKAIGPSISTLILDQVPVAVVLNLLKTSYTLEALQIDIQPKDYELVKESMLKSKSLLECNLLCGEEILDTNTIVHENRIVAKRRKRRSIEMLEMARKLIILDSVFSKPIQRCVLDTVAPKQLPLEIHNRLTSTLLNRQSIGLLIGPYTFSFHEILRRSFTMNDQRVSQLVRELMVNPNAPRYFHSKSLLEPHVFIPK